MAGCGPCGQPYDLRRHVTVLQVALDVIELIDQVQCDVSASCFALGLYFLRFDELAARVRPAAQSLQSVLCSQRVVTA